MSFFGIVEFKDGDLFRGPKAYGDITVDHVSLVETIGFPTIYVDSYRDTLAIYWQLPKGFTYGERGSFPFGRPHRETTDAELARFIGVELKRFLAVPNNIAVEKQIVFI